jgi:hypothetical protein
MKEELKAVGWRALGYFVVLEALLAAAILFWPRFEQNLDALKGMAPMQVLADLVDTIDRTGVIAYVNGQHFFKACNAVGTAAAVFFAMGAVAGEAHRGTLEIWLARPFSRRRMLTQRFVAGGLALVVPVIVSTATIPWLLAFVDEELELGPLLLCAAHQSLFLLAFYALTFLYSCASSKPAQIAFVVLMLSTFEFAIYMIQEVTHWSIFRLADVKLFAEIYDARALDPRLVVPIVACTAVAFELSQRVFARRTP